MQTVTNEKPIEAKAHWNPLPYGYEIIGQYELKCPVCGSVYYERSYVTPDRMMHTEYTPCQCIKREIYMQRIEQHKAEARQRLEGQLNYYFGKYDMLRDPGYKHMTFSIYRPSDETHHIAFKAMKMFKNGDSACLFGAPGRGKTHLAVACARHQRSIGNIVLAIKCVNILQRIKSTYGDDKEAENDVLDICRDVDLLVVDDIGTENPTGWVLEKLYTIIDYRVEHKKSSIFTTNLTGEEMKKKLGRALTSRIWGAGGPKMQFEITGKDWRVA